MKKYLFAAALFALALGTTPAARAQTTVPADKVKAKDKAGDKMKATDKKAKMKADGDKTKYNAKKGTVKEKGKDLR